MSLSPREKELVYLLKSSVMYERGRAEEAEKSLKTATSDWAEEDTAIKAICKAHGISTEWEQDFKPAQECVKELADKLDRTEKALCEVTDGIQADAERYGKQMHAVDALRALVDRLNACEQLAIDAAGENLFKWQWALEHFREELNAAKEALK